jgi:hypothetical protein
VPVGRVGDVMADARRRRRNVRKLKIIEHSSQDLLIQASAPTEDGDYPQGGWTLLHRDSAVGSAILTELQARQDSVLPPETYK